MSERDFRRDAVGMLVLFVGGDLCGFDRDCGFLADSDTSLDSPDLELVLFFGCFLAI